METHARCAFTAALLLDRRQHAVGSGAPITAVALDPSGRRLYLGLEDGVLEEHAVTRSEAGVRAALAARKHAAKKVSGRGGGGGSAAIRVLLPSKQACFIHSAPLHLLCRPSTPSARCQTMGWWPC